MEDDDFVPAETELLQAALEAFLVVEKIADDNDDAARLGDAGDVGHRRRRDCVFCVASKAASRFMMW